jgi:hypothetical protein
MLLLEMRRRRLTIGVAVSFVLAAIASAALVELGHGSKSAETRAGLPSVVVQHVNDLLANRFDAAWERVHPDDRRAVGRKLWEQCKRSPDASLTAVRYRGVRVVRSRAVTFDVEVTVEVRALLSGAPLRVRDVSHWTLNGGHWARLVEPRKLVAYAAGQCPGS